MSTLATVLLLAGLSSTATATPTAPVVLKEMPAKGALRLGEVIYVDDGKCPAGKVTEITGGTRKRESRARSNVSGGLKAVELGHPTSTGQKRRTATAVPHVLAELQMSAMSKR